MSDEYESERTVTRNEAAMTLREVADGVISGSIQFDLEDETVTVVVPDELELELELETEDGSRSIEVELEWSDTEAEFSIESTDAQAAEGSTQTGGEESSEPTGLQVSAAGPTESFARFEVFRDRSDEWRWRLKHRNGNIIATSGESYTEKHNAKKGLQSVMNNAPDAEIVDKSGFE